MRDLLYVKKVYGRLVNDMNSIPEKATCETGLTFHQPECLSDIMKDCTFTLLDNAQQNNMGIHTGIRFSKIKPGNCAHRYAKVRLGKRKTKYAPCALLGLVPDRHKAVRHMVSINERVHYNCLNRYQPLICRR